MNNQLFSKLIIIFFFPVCVFAFQGKVFDATGSNVTVVGSGVDRLKYGQKFGVYSGKEKIGEILIIQTMHTQAKANLISGKALKNAIIQVIPDQQKEEKDHFVDNGDGTVRDSFTGLIWQKCSIGQNDDEMCSGRAEKSDWKNAVKKCARLKLNNQKWRLPEKDELKYLLYCSDGTPTLNMNDYGTGHPEACGWSKDDIYTKSYTRPAIRTKHFPGTVAGTYWSGTEFTGSASRAWLVNFYDGVVLYTSTANQLYVRCVSGRVPDN